MSERSYLFVPGNRAERFDKAYTAGADVVIVDLEDAVAPADKRAARESVRAWLAPAKPVFILLNAAATEWYAGDLELVILPGVRGVVLPMAEDDDAIREIHARAGAGIKIVRLIEMALGLWRAVSTGLLCGSASPTLTREVHPLSQLEHQLLPNHRPPLHYQSALRSIHSTRRCLA
jgi:citrate lyase subunit beta/citryl-CoA lyase